MPVTAAALCLLIVMFAYFHNDGSITGAARTEIASADKYAAGDEAMQIVAATAAFEVPSPLDDADYSDMLHSYVEEPESHISES
jgi:hypothetical protein